MTIKKLNLYPDHGYILFGLEIRLQGKRSNADKMAQLMQQYCPVIDHTIDSQYDGSKTCQSWVIYVELHPSIPVDMDTLEKQYWYYDDLIESLIDKHNLEVEYDHLVIEYSANRRAA